LVNVELHHIGIAVTNIDATAKFYCTMGYVLTETIEDKIQNVYIAFLENERGRLELVQLVDKTSPVCNILKKIGVSAYHFCYETNDFYSTIMKLEKKRVQSIGIACKCNWI